jgi:tRNA-dihydrouridine synthase
MEDVSDPPFRRLCKMHGADMMYSEFISSEGLFVTYQKPNEIRYLIMNTRGSDFCGDEAMALSSKLFR